MMPQRVGNISGSKGVAIEQATGGSDEQQVGDISASQDIRIVQHSHGATLREAEGALNEVLQLAERAGGGAAHAIVSDARAEIVKAIGAAEIPTTAIVSARQDPDPDVPEDTRHAIRDLSAAVSLASGSVAIADISDLRVLLLAVPAVLLLTGYLAAPHLLALCQRIVLAARGRARGRDSQG